MPSSRTIVPRITSVPATITTNDNTTALRFYQRNGFDLIRLDRYAVDRARRLKPAIPTHADGIPFRHELELELRLRTSP